MSKSYELFIGPNHPGVPGNFSLHLELEGDTIVSAKGDPGYLHRAFEKGMENRLYLQNLALIPRICVPEPDINEAAYAMAVEDLMGVEIPERAKYIRTIVLEAARVTAYLLWMSGYAGSLGNFTLYQWCVGDRDYMIDMFAALTGARIYHMYIIPGGVRRDLPAGWEDEILSYVKYMRDKLEDYDNLFFKNALFAHRARGVAKITQEQALDLGATGPVLKATGIPQDVRKDDPYAAYPELNFEVPVMKEGDSWARAIVRRMEIDNSLSLIEQAVKKIPKKGPVWEKMPNPLKWNVPEGEVYAKVESARGEHGFYMVSDGTGKPYRVAVRGASYSHMFAIAEKLLVGARLADASHILLSLDICPPEIDR